VAFKWPWNRQQNPSEHASNGDLPIGEMVERQPEPSETPLHTQVQLLATELASLRLEWAEVLDKINRWASRQAARERQRAVRELSAMSDDQETLQEAQGPTNDAGMGSQADRATIKAQLRARARQTLGR